MSRPKIIFVVTEDWFFHSHFLPLVEAARRAGAGEIILAANVTGSHEAIGKHGVRVSPVAFERASRSPLSALRLMLRLNRLFRRQAPDIIHFISWKPILVGGLAARLAVAAHASIYHITGHGILTGDLDAGFTRMGARAARLLIRFLRDPRSWLLLENPDDGQALSRIGRLPADRVTMLGGAGVDPESFPPWPPADDQPLRLAFVGRLIWSKGLDVLIRALDLVRQAGQEVHLDIHGAPDPDNPRPVAMEDLRRWSRRPDVTWHGRSDDVSGAWKQAAVAVVPSRGGEGLPRSMLEAASSARPLIVTDVPGCRRFVRHGQEGLIVPPADPEALARAILELAADTGLRRRMGAAARQRVLDGFTQDHVIADMTAVYERLLRETGGGGTLRGKGPVSSATSGEGRAS